MMPRSVVSISMAFTVFGGRAAACARRRADAGVVGHAAGFRPWSGGHRGLSLAGCGYGRTGMNAEKNSAPFAYAGLERIFHERGAPCGMHVFNCS